MTALVLALGTINSWGAPRPPQPTIPSFGFLFNEGFNQPYEWPKDSAIDFTIWTESFSGWALNRQGEVDPFVNTTRRDS